MKQRRGAGIARHLRNRIVSSRGFETVNDKLSATAGFRINGGDWAAPVRREDWIFSPSAGLSLAPGRNFTLDLTYSYDRAESRVPNTAGREFTRQLVFLSAKYRF